MTQETINKRRWIVPVAIVLFCCASTHGQQGPLAEQIQSVRPNILLADQIQYRGVEATRSACIRPCDEVWLISTRKVACITNNPDQLGVMRIEDQHWLESSFQELCQVQASTDDTQTVVYVHGNMTDLNWSIARGLEVYKNLIATPNTAPPIRFVLWSWPSERQTVPVRDAIVKGKRAVCEGETLRTTMDALPGERPLLIGYSFGAQVVVSALQSTTSNWTGEPYLVSLIAPAFERDYIHCQIDTSAIESSTKQMFAFVSSIDPVIRANGILCRRGYRRSGICDYRVSTKLGCGGYLTEFDISDCSCRKHSIALYSRQHSIVDWIGTQLSCKSLPGDTSTVASLDAE